MRLLLNPFASGGGGGYPAASPAPAQPQGSYGQPGQYGPQQPYSNPMVSGQGTAFVPVYGGQPQPQPQPVGTYQNPIQPTYQVQPYQDPNQPQYNPGVPAQYGPTYQVQPGFQYPGPVPGLTPPGQPYQGQPPGSNQPFQFGPGQYPLAPQPPQPQGQPGSQPGIIGTLPAGLPNQPPALTAADFLNREPQSLQEAQQQLQALRQERITALSQAGQTKEAMQLQQQYYQQQLQTATSALAQRDQALAGAALERVLSDSLFGITFRDQANALNCRTLLANRIEIGPDGVGRERGTGRPIQQALPDYLRGDFAVFLAPSTTGGGPGLPQGQYPGPQNPNPGPLSPGEIAMQRWEQSRRQGLAQGQFLPGWQQFAPQAQAPYAAFAGR